MQPQTPNDTAKRQSMPKKKSRQLHRHPLDQLPRLILESRASTADKVQAVLRMEDAKMFTELLELLNKSSNIKLNRKLLEILERWDVENPRLIRLNLRWLTYPNDFFHRHAITYLQDFLRKSQNSRNHHQKLKAALLESEHAVKYTFTYGHTWPTKKMRWKEEMRGLSWAFFDVLGEEGTPFLWSLLLQAPHKITKRAAYTLGKVSGEQAKHYVPLLLEKLETVASYQQDLYYYTLGQLGPRAHKALPTLLKRYHQESQDLYMSMHRDHLLHAICKISKDQQQLSQILHSEFSSWDWRAQREREEYWARNYARQQCHLQCTRFQKLVSSIHEDTQTMVLCQFLESFDEWPELFQKTILKCLSKLEKTAQASIPYLLKLFSTKVALAEELAWTLLQVGHFEKLTEIPSLLENPNIAPNKRLELLSNCSIAHRDPVLSCLLSSSANESPEERQQRFAHIKEHIYKCHNETTDSFRKEWETPLF